MTIRVTLHCPLIADKFDDLTPFLKENLPNVRAFDGCLTVGVYFDAQRTEMLLEEEWISVQQHQEYMAAIERSGALAQLAAFFEGPPTIRYFEKEIL